jgi:uncharacterized protein YjbJ (UPF0337 family)
VGNEERIMDTNREKGAGHELKGSVKEGVGKVTGNRSQQLEGNLEKNAGKVQHAVGKASDDISDDLDEDSNR